MRLRSIEEPVRKAGAVLSRDLGGRITAVFGVLPTAGTPEEAAVSAALRMQRPATPSAFEASIGLASGPAVVGLAGRTSMRTFHAVGACFDRASELAWQARPGELLVDSTTSAGASSLRGRLESCELEAAPGAELRRVYRSIAP